MTLLRRLVGAILLLLLVLALLWPPPAWGKPSTQPSGHPVAGARLFEQHCAGCHLHGGNIVRRGRTLKLKALERHGFANPEAIARIAADGSGRMGGYRNVLGEGGPEAVAQWVWEQALAGWPKS